MPTAPAYLSTQIIQELTALEGRAKVSHHQADANSRIVERIVKLLIFDGLFLTYGSTDEEYTSAKLVDQKILEQDDTHGTVYRRWEEPSSITGRSYSPPLAFGIPCDVVTDTVVASTTLASLSVSVLSQEIEPIDQVFAKRTTTSLKSGQTQPTLYEFPYDERTGLTFAIEKTLVAAQTSATSQTAGTTTEYRSVDKWRSIKIVSRTNANEAALAALARSYPTTVEHSFPNVLRSAAWKYQLATSSGGILDIGLSLITTIERGYSGPCNATVYEYYTYDPVTKLAGLSSDKKTITKFFPTAFTTNSAYVIEGPQSKAIIQTFAIPETLHDTITLTASGNTALTISDFPGLATTIPATTPTATAFDALTTIVKDIQVSVYKIGIYFLRVVVVDIPHP